MTYASDMTHSSDREGSPFPQSLFTLSRTEHTTLALQVEGVLPTDLCGHAFVIGPAGAINSPVIPDSDLIQPSLDGTPLFNGDAMIYRLDFDRVRTENQVFLTNKIAKTPCYYTDLASFKTPKYQPLAYGNYGLARLSLSLGFRNEVNTALIPMTFSEAEGARLIITWDAGRPYELDPLSLEIVTPVGWNREWRSQIELPLPFGINTTTAHACFDPYTADPGKLFTVNYGKSIPTALSLLLHPDQESRWSELERFLETIEQRLAPIAHALTRIGGHPAPTDEPSSSWQLAKAQIGSAIAQGVLKLNRCWLGLERRLPHPSIVSHHYHSLWQELLDVLEQTLIQGISEFTTIVNDILELIAGLKILLPAAFKMDDFVDLIVWDGQQELQKWNVVVREAGETHPIRIRQSMHQIALTQDYVVLMDTVFKLGAEQLITNPFPKYPELEAVLRRVLDFDESTDTVVYIVRRCDLTADQTTVTAKKVVIPRGAAHFLADYANRDRKITLHLAHNTAWDPAEWTRAYDDPYFPGAKMPLGMSVAGMDVNHWGQYTIDGETGELCESRLLTDFDHSWMTAIYAYNGVNPPRQFKTIYWNSWGCWQDLLSQFIYRDYEDFKYREVPVETILAMTQQGVPVNLCRVDIDRMAVTDYYAFPPGHFGNSAQFVPRCQEGTPHDDEDESTNGYLVCIVHADDHPTSTEFWIFDARNLAQGPLCKLSHPSLKIGMTIHSTWLPQINSRQARYAIPVRADYQPLLDQLPDGDRKTLIQDLFEDAVYPHFQ
jgi:carotenoid cleavage dioxygenase-like enzyme